MRLLKILAFCVTISLLSSAACFAAEAGKFTAGIFWKAFREAVLVNNEKKLLAMTKLPLEVRGLSDTDPAKYYSRKQFSPIFRKLLMQQELLPVKGRLVTKTMLGLIYEKKDLGPQDLLTPDFFRFYQFEFHFMKGKWLLTRVYLEEE